MEICSEQCERLIDPINIDNLVIAFLVPDELLNYDFECWQITTDDGLFPLGLQHRVVVRSAKRITNGMMHPSQLAAWKRRWDVFKRLEKQDHTEDFACICSSKECRLKNFRLNADSSCAVLFCGQRECQSQPVLQAALRNSSIVCVALAYPPLESITNVSGDICTGAFSGSTPLFQTLRRTGVPIALSPKNGINNTEPLASSLSWYPLSSLPKNVMDWRLDVARAKEEQTIGLLLDDPSRLPPTSTEEYYKPPASRK